MEIAGTDALIMERMTKVISDVLKPGSQPITLDKRFKEDLGADSLDVVSLLMALEEEFHTQISDEEAARFTTVGAAFDYVKVKAAQKAS
jgi:acyl carrier protein